MGGGLQAKYFDQVAAFVSFLKIRYAKRPCSEKVKLGSFGPQGMGRERVGEGSASKIFAATCCIRDSLYFDMQRDHALK